MVPKAEMAESHQPGFLQQDLNLIMHTITWRHRSMCVGKGLEGPPQLVSVASLGGRAGRMGGLPLCTGYLNFVREIHTFCTWFLFFKPIKINKRKSILKKKPTILALVLKGRRNEKYEKWRKVASYHQVLIHSPCSMLLQDDVGEVALTGKQHVPTHLLEQVLWRARHHLWSTLYVTQCPLTLSH